MAEWAPKRFWKETQVVPAEGGWTVQLDGRAVKTPAKAPLVVPTRALAEAIAAEWQAQEDKVDPATMPFTRAANAAIDKVTVQFDEVAAMLASYGDSDLLCYRAEGPEGLVARQAEAWDPLLDWVAEAFGAPLTPVSGVMHAAQPEQSLKALEARVRALTPFEMTAFHDLVTISGSLVIGLAAVEGRAGTDVLWPLSRIDEDWQAEQWGRDDEAAEHAELRREAFEHAGRFFDLTRRAD
ncbi:ATP12 family chaperone protein [Acidimangrovimonas pyrenivorans]|uniref:ATP12 family chaperone protein n=1 Tax=Acidimangrovimonas pyrenivorans TaxID=2030798 RepID=A0ABV7AHS1_9RHOB